MNGKSLSHNPVLLSEVINAISPESGKLYFDATFGWGGYTKKLLESCDCNVIAIDQDPSVGIKANEFKMKYGDRFNFIKSKFSQIPEVLGELGISKVDGFMFDIGVSSMQLDSSDRGFSFNKEGPLDMRMSSDGVTAAEFINSIKEEELADIIYNYGDERKSRRIAKFIIEQRSLNPIETTLQLADIVSKANPKKFNHKKHPATKTFQAIRIHVNNELEHLEIALSKVSQLLNKKGVIAIISFHSLEDRIVKNFFKPDIQSLPKDIPINNVVKESFHCIKKKIKPSAEEIKRNPRSRSAVMRVYSKL